MTDAERIADLEHRLRRHRAVMVWVAVRLRRLASLEPHKWDRSTLLELMHALTDNPLLK